MLLLGNFLFAQKVVPKFLGVDSFSILFNLRSLQKPDPFLQGFFLFL